MANDKDIHGGSFAYPHGLSLHPKGDEFLSAAQCGDGTTIARMLDATPALATTVSSLTGETALHKVAVNGSCEALHLLLERAPELSRMVDKDGRTALLHAVMHDKRDVVNILVQSHPEMLIAQDNWGRTAIHYAIDYGTPAIAEQLLRHAPDLARIATRDGRTPLECVGTSSFPEQRQEFLTLLNGSLGNPQPLWTDRTKDVAENDRTRQTKRLSRED